MPSPASPSQNAEPTLTFHKGTFAAVMLAAAGLGAGTAAMIASAMGGDARTTALAVVVVAVASVLSVLPALLPSPVAVSKFGFAVLAGSMGRTLGVMVFGLLFQNMHDLAKRPFWLAIVTGAAVVLIIEVVQAISLLKKSERAGR